MMNRVLNSGKTGQVRFFALAVFAFYCLFAGMPLWSSGGGDQVRGQALTLTDDNGQTATFQTAPKTIVSIAPSVTETFFALGAGNLLVGRSEVCDFPADALKLPAVATYGSINMEAISALKAELVIDANLYGPDALAALRQNGIQALSYNPTETVQGTLEFIEKIGKLTSREAQAKTLRQSIEAKLADISRRIGSASKPNVYYVVGFGEGGDWTAGKDTFIHQLILQAGGRNAAAELSGWQISREALVSLDPDIIILPATWAKVSDFVNAPFYKDLRASKQGKVFLVENDLTERPGPRLADGVEALAKIIHPTLIR